MRHLRFTCALLVVATLACGVVSSARAAQAPEGWVVENLGKGAYFDGEPVWTRGALAWAEEASEEVTRSMMFFDFESRRRTTLCATPPGTRDFGLGWSGGRFYWARSFDTLDPEGNTEDNIHLRTEFLSMAPSDAMPTVVLTRPEAYYLLVAANRLVWAEPRKHGRFTVMTMRTSEAIPSQVLGLGEAEADLKLSERMLVWAPLKGAHSIRVLSIDSSGSLSPTVTILPVGGPGAVYQASSLSIDGPRIAWSAREGTSRWYVYTWRLGDEKPARVSTQPSGKIVGMDAYQETEAGWVDPVVSGERVSWTDWSGKQRRVLTRATGDASPTVLGVYRHPRHVASLAGSGDRVAWNVVQAALSLADDPGLLPVVYTWKAGGTRSQVVTGSQDADVRAWNVSVGGDRIAYTDGEGHVYLAEPATEPIRVAATPASSPARQPLAALAAVMALLAAGGVAAFLTARPRRRGDSGSV